MGWLQPFMFLTMCTQQLYDAHEHECFINVKKIKVWNCIFDTFTHLRASIAPKVCFESLERLMCMCIVTVASEAYNGNTTVTFVDYLCIYLFMFYLKL